FQDLISIFQLHLPDALTNAPFDYNSELGRLVGTGKYLDLPAMLIVAAVTCVLVVRIRESATFNASMVILTVVIVIFVIAVGSFYVNTANWHPFAPYGYTGVNFFGKTLLGQHDLGGQPLRMLARA